MFQGNSEAHSAHDNDSESDDDPTDLHYFEPAVSDDSDDNTQQHEVGRIMNYWCQTYMLQCMSKE